MISVVDQLSRRALGVDLGSVRIGIALCDSAGTVATPLQTLRRSGDEALDHQRLCALAVEEGAETVVFGMPRSLDGGQGAAAVLVAAEVERFRERLSAIRDAAELRVEVVDERLSTVSAHRSLAAGGMNSRKRRDIVDQVAAAVFLQAWLDSTAPRRGSNL